MKKHKMSQGFTLIELMIVVAIIGILAAIAIPQFADLVAKSQEGRTKANLGTVRSALSIYYGDTEGWYPLDAASSTGLASLTNSGKYLQAMPNSDLPRTVNNQGHTSIPAVAISVTDAGGWYYNNGGSASSTWGAIVVNCSHKDLRGVTWSSY
jgi:prepilin-type N-terminal cleavage/methylation domain-containing protein